MGSQVTAKCVCGYQAESLIGGGMSDFGTICYFPCLCESCESIVEANLLSKEPNCPDCNSPGCIPYDDSRLIGSPGVRTIADWNVHERLGRVLILTDGSYKCPECGKMELTFSSGGLLWD